MASIRYIIISIIISCNTFDLINCDKIKVNEKDAKRLNLIINCIITEYSSEITQFSYKYCANSYISNDTSYLTKSKSTMKLICLDHQGLTLKFLNQTNAVVAYMIKMFMKKNRIFISDSPTFIINNLKSKTTFKIIGTIFIRQTNNDDNDNAQQFKPITNQLIVKTLSKNHQPKNIKNLNIIKYTFNPDFTKLNALVKWSQSADFLCNYRAILSYPNYFYSSEYYQSTDQEYLITDLMFKQNYEIGIQTIIKQRNSYYNQSALITKQFYAPERRVYKPENISVINSYWVAENIYNLTIRWNKPIIEPSSYSIKIMNFQNNHDKVVNNVSGNVTEFFLENVVIIGVNYGILIIARSPIGLASSHTNEMLTISNYNTKSEPQKQYGCI